MKNFLVRASKRMMFYAAIFIWLPGATAVFAEPYSQEAVKLYFQNQPEQALEILDGAIQKGEGLFKNLSSKKMN